MPEDFVQIKLDIGDLKSNVNVIKTEVTDMKATLTTAIDKISISMAQMAAVTEKLLYNDEAHRGINLKIEEIIETQLEHHDTISALKSSHEACLNTRRQVEEDKKNSPWQRAKDKSIEYLFIVVVTLLAFVLFSHFNDYITYINNNGKTKVTTTPIPSPVLESE